VVVSQSGRRFRAQTEERNLCKAFWNSHDMGIRVFDPPSIDGLRLPEVVRSEILNEATKERRGLSIVLAVIAIIGMVCIGDLYLGKSRLLFHIIGVHDDRVAFVVMIILYISWWHVVKAAARYLFIRSVRKAMGRRGIWKCPECGYDVGLGMTFQSKCPECGSVISYNKTQTDRSMFD
jgi:hypothetical protein